MSAVPVKWVFSSEQCLFSEDDEEENEPEVEAERAEGAEGDERGDDEPPVKVKDEEDQGKGPSKSKAAREKTPPNELKMFSERYLAELDKRQLMANVELVDGTPSLSGYVKKTRLTPLQNA